MPPTPTWSLVDPRAAAAKIADPQPPNTSRKVPSNSAPSFLDMVTSVISASGGRDGGTLAPPGNRDLGPRTTPGPRRPRGRSAPDQPRTASRTTTGSWSETATWRTSAPRTSTSALTRTWSRARRPQVGREGSLATRRPLPARLRDSAAGSWLRSPAASTGPRQPPGQGQERPGLGPLARRPERHHLDQPPIGDQAQVGVQYGHRSAADRRGHLLGHPRLPRSSGRRWSVASVSGPRVRTAMP